MSYSHELTAELFDAGARMSDTINEKLIHHTWANIKTQWMAFSIADGRSDGTMYDSKRDAVKHQQREQDAYYVCFKSLMGGASQKDCAIMIKFARDAAKAGLRFVDPDSRSGGPDALMNTATHDLYNRSYMRDRLKLLLSDRSKRA